jgi:hypothetical protein
LSLLVVDQRKRPVTPCCEKRPRLLVERGRAKGGNHRVAVRGSGSFSVGNADGINTKYRKLLYRADRCCYARQPALPPRSQERDFQRGRP